MMSLTLEVHMSKNIRIKPGKGASMVGMVTGIVFCIIGVLFVIPTFGLFGVFWTGVTLLIAIINGINAFSDRGISSYEISVDDVTGNRNTPESGGRTENATPSDHFHEDAEAIQKRLSAAAELYHAGSITKEEYEEKRREILDRL